MAYEKELRHSMATIAQFEADVAALVEFVECFDAGATVEIPAKIMEWRERIEPVMARYRAQQEDGGND